MDWWLRVGLTLAILFTNPFAVIGGLFVVGIGPFSHRSIAYSIAPTRKPSARCWTGHGHHRRLLRVFLFGPPIIGLLADMFTLRYALLLTTVILFVVMTVLSLRYNSGKSMIIQREEHGSKGLPSSFRSKVERQAEMTYTHGRATA